MLINMRVTKSVVPVLSADIGSLEDALFDGEEFQVMPRPADVGVNPAAESQIELLNKLGELSEFISFESKHKRLHSIYSEKDLSTSLTKMYRSAKASLEENGASTLYLALGMLRWFEQKKNAQARYAPIVLVPIDIVRKSAGRGYAMQMRDEDSQINITLLEFLKQNYEITIPGMNPPPQDEHGMDMPKIFAMIRKAVMSMEMWDVLEVAVIGNFSFSQFVMWNDIHNNRDFLEGNKIVHSLIEGAVDWDCMIPEEVDQEEAYLPVTADASQLHAINMAAAGVSFVLHGPPGTGKTTTTLGIISAYKQAGCEIILAAPTGRAAKRMSEATGMEAKTIHRLLEYKPPEGYQKNEDHPLEGDVLILDECSMIDIMLMYNLLKAMPEQMSLILVGDIDQLPSVGAGNVLRDIIDSGQVPVVRLNRIFRQAQGSRIIMNAHRINRGESIDMRGGKDADFFFAPKESNQDVVNTIVQYCKTNLPRYYHVDPLQDIQVLTPMQRGECGAINLNQVLQEAMNPSKIFLRRGGTQYRLNDKVMQIRNDYEKEVFNGDIGTITKVDMEERELTVLFETREVVYDVTELDELMLAYAVTIHKSQGSEYPIVVMPFTMSHFVMLQRNLLYTGVTRAKKILVLVGEKKAIYYAIRNETTTRRNTCLARRLQSDSEESKEAFSHL